MFNPTASTTSSSSGAVTAATSAPVAPLIEPPSAFGYVAPGVYRCSASSLTKGLPPAPKGWQPTPQLAQQDSSRATTAANMAGLHSMSPNTTILNGNGQPVNRIGDGKAGFSANEALSTTPFPHAGLAPQPPASVPMQHGPHPQPGANVNASNASPTEAFLSSLQLRTILFLAPEKKPISLAAWSATHQVRLVHLGLGALADSDDVLGAGMTPQAAGATCSTAVNAAGGAVRAHAYGRGTNAGSLGKDVSHPDGRASQAFWEPHGGTASTDMMSLERIAKESLEILLDRANLPCLICDMSGVNEAGIVVGCLRRLQRFNFASIRLEYRSYAGNRARSSHERFIEMFDTDLLELPPDNRLPTWFAEQLKHDEEETKG